MPTPVGSSFVDELAAVGSDLAATALAAKRAVRDAMDGPALGAGAELLGELHRRALGTGAEALADLCAAPFTHRPALAPEIWRLRALLDRCPEDNAQLHLAHAQLEAIERVLPELPAALAAGSASVACA